MTTTQAEALQDESDQANDSASAMNDRLRKEVSSWREGRSDGTSRQATELSVAVTKHIVPPTNAKMKRAKPVAEPEKPAVPEAKKPFGMSYDGMSRGDYVKYMAARRMK